MTKIALTLLLLQILACSVSAQRKSYWTGVFVGEKITTNSTVRERCKVALDQPQMDEVLKSVGWNFERRTPTVNWDEDIPVIIAPGKTYASFDLVFIDLNWNGQEFTLKWGWWNKSDRFYRGSSTKTVGAKSHPEQILIVVVKRYVYTANKLFCKEFEAG